jgi:cytochrome c5
MQKRTALVCAAFTLAVLGWLAAIPGRVAAQAPQVLIESLAGKDSYGMYCAPCHGEE